MQNVSWLILNGNFARRKGREDMKNAERLTKLFARLFSLSMLLLVLSDQVYICILQPAFDSRCPKNSRTLQKGRKTSDISIFDFK